MSLTIMPLLKKTADIKEDEEEKKCDKRKEWN
jgi:hypothetical protein